MYSVVDSSALVCNNFHEASFKTASALTYILSVRDIKYGKLTLKKHFCDIIKLVVLCVCVASYTGSEDEDEATSPREREQKSSKGFTDFCVRSIIHAPFGRREITLAENGTFYSICKVLFCVYFLFQVCLSSKVFVSILYDV
jgi:hypothetical protein